MFIHNLKYNLKILFNNKMLIFWTFIFPIILGTLFKMAFANLEKGQTLNTINIAIVNDIAFQTDNLYNPSFQTLTKNNPDLLKIKYVHNIAEAEELLKDKKVSAYLYLDDSTPQVIVQNDQLTGTVLSEVIAEIKSTDIIVTDLANAEYQSYIAAGAHAIDFAGIYNDCLTKYNQITADITDVSPSNLNYTMIEFYTLIAMTCFYGGLLSLNLINKNLPNMGNIGKRISTSPIRKITTILSSFLASYIASIIGLTLLFIYSIFILKVDFGSHLLPVILLTLTGSLAGISLGIFIATTFKIKENSKTIIVISLTMLGCFLSGMMGITMKYLVDTNIPILNKLNPVNMITDGFYSLYYYDTLTRFNQNLISLLIFSAILIIISLISLRRQQHDNI